MKVLLLNGSPHATGCTFTALQVIEDELKEQGIDSEIINVGAKPVAGCTGCGACSKNGTCVFDDGVNKLAARLSEFDGMIVGSPVHYAAASGSITSFMDRLFFSAGKYLKYKPGAAIVSCRRGGASAAFDQLNKYYSISEMPIITSHYWNQVHGNSPEEVMQDLEGIRTMRTLARNMAYYLKMEEAAKATGLVRPEPLPVVKTNFIR